MNIVNQILNEREMDFGGKTYKIIPNMAKSFKLSKYRNKSNFNIDITPENKPVLEKILNLLEEVKDTDITNEEFMKMLSDEEVLTFYEMTQKNVVEYELEDCKYILSVVLEMSLEEAEKAMNAEFELEGYDGIQNKVNAFLNLVFTNAKASSLPKTAKEELGKVAEK